MDFASYKMSDVSATTATIHIESLKHNLRVFQKSCPGLNIMAVVKANAYGHGSVPIAAALIQEGISFLAVATISEAVELRTAGISERILVFGAPRKSCAAAYDEFDLEATITGTDSLAELESVSSVKVHINLDTGMGRVGLQADELESTVRTIEQHQHLELIGLGTHFSTADHPDSTFTGQQWSRFLRAVDVLGSAPAEIHAASSSAVFTVPESIDTDIVTVARIGVGLYGLLDLPNTDLPSSFRPVMTLESEISHIKNVSAGTPISYDGTWRAPRSTRIASVAAGYADGVPRHLSNCGLVHIGGKAYPIVGTVCMDMFMVDIGSHGYQSRHIHTGDPVIIFGKNGPSAIEVARTAGTIAYELVCRVGNRVPRIYFDENLQDHTDGRLH